MISRSEMHNGVTPAIGDCVYTSCYCEENVWKLCDFVRREQTAPLDQLDVVFISNENRTVPLWEQKSGQGEEPVIWDYHVVLLQTVPQSGYLIYDLDSELPFPCHANIYIHKALRSDQNLKPQYHRKLRVIPANDFLSRFSSDRSHMKNSDGTWKMPPPPYPPISTAECQTNLEDFISVSPFVGWGVVYSLQSFTHRYSPSPASSSAGPAHP
ncbi:protein N-terminal glutamine amidohydrolase-like [Gouania willdenowi]|uniref:Protein N-terminal glutamine amidohydrolase n=1 Tax=Gouania willdenowi TaxID=441366 RepID=A0A8C5DH41_GOUWI|nr:protein N-terminal glutamine amidohydrolase-like [Gouania willdenowi]